MRNPRSTPSSHFIRDLVSSIQAPQGLKLPALKSLYYLIVHWSASGPICDSRAGVDLTFGDIETGRQGIRVSLEDICGLSDALFKNLSVMFKQFLFSLQDVTPRQALVEASLCSHIEATSEQLNLLLRCCLVILNLLCFDQHRLLENGQVLLALLEELSSLTSVIGNEKISIGFEKVSCAYSYKDLDSASSFTEDLVASLHFIEPSDPCLPFLCTMLEVFADELLVHRQLREYFKLIDCHSSTSRKLFVCDSSHGDVESVIEVICTHFCLAFYNEQAYEDFLSRLFCWHENAFRVPQVGLSAALALLLNPIMLLAPKLVQAHLVSMVSEAITFGMGLESMQPDVRLMNCYLSAFERSVILYVKHMSTLQIIDHLQNGENNFSTRDRNRQPSFESFIQPVTRKTINHLISKLDDSWQSQLHDMHLRTKTDLATSSIAYMKAGKHILDVSSRDEIMSILSCIILKAFADEVDNSLLRVSGDTSPQDIYFLAAILKLMSCSLLQAIRCLTHNGNLGCLKTLKDFSSCKEYEFLVGVISCFQQFNIHLPIQKFLWGIMETHLTQHEESRLMFLHFSGLLSLSFSSGLDFLVKGCISTMMALMNLFVFEGNLDGLRFGGSSELSSSELPPDSVQEAMVNKKSSITVASRFLKIQTLYLRTRTLDWCYSTVTLRMDYTSWIPHLFLLQPATSFILLSLLFPFGLMLL
ncbi:uncharacterized protein LOC127808903 isoform X3 [Diospyros lotus]|uniref:uncharacterized protein LOC127808903 isoform X3 n=1 Tax=Diospyros lotus TaxID=55363 RepID=UPI00224D3BC1|nr:uncharacterized protein LOC127808903 isoform X3 [Diospyros lotus]